jgi:hypothetical protein
MSDLISDAFATDRDVAAMFSWGSRDDRDPTEADEEADAAASSLDSAPEWGIGDDDVPF